MKLNKSCIIRLHKYRDALFRLRNLGFVKVFSENLADAVGGTSSQVRKDFSLFGIIGNKKGGYIIDELIKQLDKILGKDKLQPVIVVGAGRIGMALMNYPNFEKVNIRIVAAFDNDPNKLNNSGKIPVYSLDELADFIQKENIKVAILAVPDYNAQNVLELLVKAGIMGVLNFAPVKLKAPETVYINNINVRIELETVIYFVNALTNQQAEQR